MTTIYSIILALSLLTVIVMAETGIPANQESHAKPVITKVTKNAHHFGQNNNKGTKTNRGSQTTINSISETDFNDQSSVKVKQNLLTTSKTSQLPWDELQAPNRERQFLKDDTDDSFRDPSNGTQLSVQQDEGNEQTIKNNNNDNTSNLLSSTTVSEQTLTGIQINQQSQGNHIQDSQRLETLIYSLSPNIVIIAAITVVVSLLLIALYCYRKNNSLVLNRFKAAVQSYMTSNETKISFEAATDAQIVQFGPATLQSHGFGTGNRGQRNSQSNREASSTSNAPYDLIVVDSKSSLPDEDGIELSSDSDKMSGAFQAKQVKRKKKRMANSAKVCVEPVVADEIG